MTGTFNPAVVADTATFSRGLYDLHTIARGAFDRGATDYGIATAVMRYALDSECCGDLSESDIRDLSWSIALTFIREEN